MASPGKIKIKDQMSFEVHIEYLLLIHFLCNNIMFCKVFTPVGLSTIQVRSCSGLFFFSFFF